MARIKSFNRITAAVWIGLLASGFAQAQNAVFSEPAVSFGVTVDLRSMIQIAPTFEGEMRKEFLRRRQDVHVRMKPHLEAYLDWAAEICGLTEEQRREAVRLAQDLGENSPGVSMTYQLTGGEPQLAPAFAHRASMATLVRLQLTEELRQSVLAPEQSARLDAALRKRTASHRRAYRDLVIATLDRELFFTAGQRIALLELDWVNSSRFDSPPPNNFFAGQDSAAFRMPDSLPGEFSPELREAWEKIFHESGISSVYAASERPPDELEQRRRQSRDALMKVAELQIAFYQQEARLKPEQLEPLRLAGKRLAAEHSRHWPKSLGQIGEVAEEAILQNGEQAVEMTVITEDGWGPLLGEGSRAELLRNHTAWQAALKQVLAGAPREALDARDEFQRNAQIGAVVTMLDEELWLREGQRPAIQELVRRNLPDSLGSFSVSSDLRNMAWCAFAIKGHGAEPPALLNEQQKTVWHLLEKSYTQDNDPRQFLSNQGQQQQINVVEDPDLPRPFFFDGLQIPQPAPEQDNAPPRTMIEIRDE